MGARQKTTAPTNLTEFLAFAADAGRGWTAAEKANWRALVGKLSDAMNGLNLHVPNIDLVKTSGEEEFGAAAYTRRHAIMFRVDDVATDDRLPPRLLPFGARNVSRSVENGFSSAR